MPAKKPIVVRIDGKTPKKYNSNSSKRDEIEYIAKKEIAAAEESREDNIHTFAREYDRSYMISKSIPKKQSNFHMFKPIIIAITSAVAIGSIMGFIMLKIIVNFDNDVNASPTVVLPATNQETGDGEQDTDSSKEGAAQYSLAPMTAYVLQGGVFSGRENAENEAEKFVEHGYQPVIWKRENQFYLLIGLASTKEVVQLMGEDLTNSGIEVYARDWQVSEVEMELTEDQYNWLNSFQELWDRSVLENNIDPNEWKLLMGDVPNQDQAFTDFTANLVTLSEQMQDAEENERQYILLSMWEKYQTFASGESMIIN